MSSPFVPEVPRAATPALPNLLDFIPEPLRPYVSAQQRDPLAGLSQARIAELAGVPEVDAERIRQFESMYGPTGMANVAQLVGEEPDQPRRGLLQSFFDIATRPQSAVTGFLTGLAGMERRRVTEDEGELIERPERVDGSFELAMERFFEGLSGAEKYRAADFGVLAYDRENTPLGERALKSGLGFILDTALDPITIASFGGSILGRRIGAEAVNAVARQTGKDFVRSAGREAQEQMLREAIHYRGMLPSELNALLQSRLSSLIPEGGLLKIDEIIDVLRYADPQGNILEELAVDAAADTLSNLYRGGGKTAAKKWAEQWGDAGIAWWKAQPQDIRGGLRIRVPFSGHLRKSQFSGAPVPKSFAVPGTEGLLDNIPVLRGLSGLGNQVRQWGRTLPIFRGAGENLSGALGYYDKKNASEAYRRFVAAAKGIVGDVEEGSGAVSWRSYQTTSNLLRDWRLNQHAASMPVLLDVGTMEQFAEQGVKLDANFLKQDGPFQRAMREVLVSIEKFDANKTPVKMIEDIFGSNPTQVEQLAYDAASSAQSAFLRADMKLQEVSGYNLGLQVGSIENYWPRIADEMMKIMNRGKAPGRGITLNRTRFIKVLNPDGTVKSWYDPLEIADMFGEDIFITNPVEAIKAYTVSFANVVAQEELIHNLLKAGIVFKGGLSTLRTVNDPSAARQAIVALQNKIQVARATLEGQGVTPGTVLTENDADLVRETLAGLIAHGHDAPSEVYQRIVQDTGRVIHRAIDRTVIEELETGGFRVVSPSGQFLTGANRWGSTTRNAQVFPSFDDARRAANDKLRVPRRKATIKLWDDTLGEFWAQTTRDLKKIEDLNPLDPQNIPQYEPESYIAQIAEIINRYGKSQDLTPRHISAKAYKDQGIRAGFIAEGTADSPQMRASMERRFRDLNLFGPESLVDDVRRMFKAVENPEGFKKWVEEVYKPFYAMQKALMTSQRGPGYVLRNIQGGWWNAYGLNVSPAYFKLSTTMKSIEYKATDAAVLKHPGDLVMQALEKRNIMESEFKDKFGKRGAELFKAFEMFGFRGNRGRGAGSFTLGTQATPSLDPSIRDYANVLNSNDLNRIQRLAAAVVSGNAPKDAGMGVKAWAWWASTMGGAAAESEDWLRLATFLKGADLYGLNDGGYAASIIVRASQFDYSDLSPFEAEFVKMIMPFYTWSRNNIPLQIRAIMAEPGKINKALRLNAALADAFGEPEDPEEPMPSYVRERFGWTIRRDLISGPEGDPISAGLIIGEPLVDVNRLLRNPGAQGGLRGFADRLNWREVTNQLNPVFGAGAEALTGVELSTGGRMPQEEVAPPWAYPFSRLGPDGERVVSARGLRFARQVITPLGMLERYFPQVLGNERLERRVYTSWASAVLGLPVSTLDPYQTGAELRAREQRTRSNLRRKMGDSYEDRVGFARRLLEQGPTPEELAVIKAYVLEGEDVVDAPIELIDQMKALDTLEFTRRISYLRAMGVGDESLQAMWNNFRPRTDAEMGVRQGAPQPLTEEQLAEEGLTPNQVARMTPEERLALLRKYTRD